MSPLTLFLGRFLGLSCFLMCTVLVARPKASLEAISSMMESPGLILVTGIFNIAGGAAMVVGHNVWSGGALPVAVTLLGLVDADQGRRPHGDALACADRLLPGAALSGVVPPLHDRGPCVQRLADSDSIPGLNESRRRGTEISRLLSGRPTSA